MPQTNSRSGLGGQRHGDIVAIQGVVVGDAESLEAHRLGVVHQLRG